MFRGTDKVVAKWTFCDQMIPYQARSVTFPYIKDPVVPTGVLKTYLTKVVKENALWW